MLSMYPTNCFTHFGRSV